MNNIVIKNIEPQSIKISGAGEVIGITAVYVNGVNVTEGSVAYVIVPTKTSELQNNSGFITEETDPTIPYYIKQIRLADITRWNNKQDELVSGVNIKTINSNSLLGSGNIDISTSYTAGTGIEITEENVINNTITSYDDLTDLPTIPTKISDLTNDSDFVESTSLAEVAFNGSYLALSNTPDSTSDFTNDGENGIDPFITNKTNSLENYYNIDYMWNILPHVSDSDTNINLSPTVSDTTLKMSLDPSTLSQDGSPSPSSPQDIHTISGSNKVVVNGKNLSKVANGNNVVLTDTLEAGTYTFSLEHIYSVGYSLKANDGDGSTITSSQPNNSGRDSVSFTINTPMKIFINGYSRTTGKTFAESVFNYQIEKGSTSTTYTPYVSQEADIDLGDIEYCKIGNYEDRIFKNVSGDTDYSSELDEGAWYIKKNIKKVKLSDGVTYVFDNGRFWARTGNGELINDAYAQSNQSVAPVMCNYLPAKTLDYATNYMGIGVNSDNHYVLIKFDDGGDTQTIWDTTSVNNYLNNNDIYVYYVTISPTYTQITGTLETQLNTIEDSLKAYNEQTNISQVNADLPFVINADTLKSLANL